MGAPTRARLWLVAAPAQNSLRFSSLELLLLLVLVVAVVVVVVVLLLVLLLLLYIYIYIYIYILALLYISIISLSGPHSLLENRGVGDDFLHDLAYYYYYYYSTY